MVTGQRMPKTELELRVLLGDDLLNHADVYKLKLNHESRRQLHLMRCQGLMPSLDILLSASQLFHVKIFVYFFSEEPVIYQIDDFNIIIIIKRGWQ